MPIGDDFQLGELEFITLDGLWRPPMEHKQAWSRAGRDGTQTATTGMRGPPFTLRSTRDCEDLQAADKLLETYRELVAGDPVACVKEGVKSDERETNPFLVDVMRVTPVTMQETPVISGGFDEDSEAILICEWHLIAVPLEA